MISIINTFSSKGEGYKLVIGRNEEAKEGIGKAGQGLDGWAVGFQGSFH